MKPVRLILDATAVEAFPALDVGEPISEVYDEGAAFTIPWPVLVTTAADDWLKYLLGHPAYRPCEIPADAWPALRAMHRTLGTVELAAALWLSAVHDCDVLTSDPGPWRALGDDPPIIVF